MRVFGMFVFLVWAQMAWAAAPPAIVTDPDGPLDFRCDNTRIHNKPNRVVCVDNVVARRGNLLVCCQTFEGFADDKWGWQRFTCNGDVRAQRSDELMWSEKSEFVLETSDLVLTGKPLPMVRRGKSLLEGIKITVNTRQDHAYVTKPRGRIEQSDEKNSVPVVVPFALEGALPEKCPIEKAPKLYERRP